MPLCKICKKYDFKIHNIFNFYHQREDLMGNWDELNYEFILMGYNYLKKI